MGLNKFQEDSKTHFHVPLRDEDEKLCNRIQSLQSSPNVSDMLQNEVESSEFVDRVSGSQRQQLIQLSRYPIVQRSFSPSHFSSQYGNSFASGISHQEMYNSDCFYSPTYFRMSNFAGYWSAMASQSGYIPRPQFSRHPYLILQQQSLGSLNNTHFEQKCYFPFVETDSSLGSPYFPQRNVNFSSGMNRQTPADKSELSSPSLYQFCDYNNTVNYQSCLPSPSLQNDWSSGSVSCNSCSELCGGCSDRFLNTFVFSNKVFESDTLSQDTPPLSQNGCSSQELPNLADSSSIRSTKASCAFSSRPFKCDECFQNSIWLWVLIFYRHKRIHLAVKPFPCPSCEKSFSRKDALKRHILVKGCIG
ncbi:hypothetical protein PORY_001291 [Pneumocystis oryctolagi]|uniref:Uncharacterized protein n=1 Tax=Pneumocystis oryctolagi TaxID=42067 RepID=A0ACB7CBX1_9ASCO|nr:hypothetical protein PORY_001291 [Pneumocystis oryctolagi]